jgi:predicted phage terminase large subunit-like protein
MNYSQPPQKPASVSTQAWLKGLAAYSELRRRQAVREAERSLSAFIAQAWHVVEPTSPFIPNWHIDAISEHLEAVTRGQIRNLLINMPPRHMKSLAVSVFWPCWEWIPNPERRWLFASYAASLSIRDSVKCRRLMQSPWYQRNWGDRFKLTGDQNAKERYENDKTGYRIATSVGGTATGEGGDRIVIDDPHNVREAESETVRQSALDWFWESMSTRLNDPKTGARVVVMQRVHASDLSGSILEHGGWDHLVLPAEYEGEKKTTSIGWSDPRTEPLELLWPDRFGRPELDELKKSLGSYAAAGQLQQRPSPAEGGLFKRDWWKFYRQAPRKFDEVVQSWDCAFKDLDTSDFVVGGVWGRIGADKYLLDLVRDRMSVSATMTAVRSLSAKWPQATAKLVEDKANGTAVIDLLKRDIAGLIPVEPEGGKVVRAQAVSPEVESGNVFLPDPSIAPWVHDFIEECAAFPNGANDDQVDMMSQALIRFQQSKPKARMLWI